MGKVLEFKKPTNDTTEEPTEDRIKRIESSLNSINNLMDAIKRNKENEDRLEQERLQNNKKVLDSYRIRRKTR